MAALQSIELDFYSDSPTNLANLLRATVNLSKFSVTVTGLHDDFWDVFCTPKPFPNYPFSWVDYMWHPRGGDSSHIAALRNALLPHAKSLRYLKIVYRLYHEERNGATNVEHHSAGTDLNHARNVIFPPLDDRHSLDLSDFTALESLWLEPNILNHNRPPPALQKFTWGLDQDVPDFEAPGLECYICRHLNGCWDVLTVLNSSPIHWTKKFIIRARELGVPLQRVHFDHKTTVWPKEKYKTFECLCWDEVPGGRLPWHHFDDLAREMWDLAGIKIDYSYGVGQREAMDALVEKAALLRQEASDLRLLELTTEYDRRWEPDPNTAAYAKFYERLGVKDPNPYDAPVVGDSDWDQLFQNETDGDAEW